MIGSLRGELVDRGADEVVVEVGGIGYRVLVSPTTAVALGEVGEEVRVWTHHHVREDAETLFGFPTAEERRCFSALLGAHKVGPSLALAILSVHGPGDLMRILAEDDVAALTLVPGVGAKTATRLLVELKSRLDMPLDLPAVSVRGDGPARDGTGRTDVRDALVELGYGNEEISSALADLPDGDPSDLLRLALRRLATA